MSKTIKLDHIGCGTVTKHDIQGESYPFIEIVVQYEELPTTAMDKARAVTHKLRGDYNPERVLTYKQPTNMPDSKEISIDKLEEAFSKIIHQMRVAFLKGPKRDEMGTF